MKKLFRLAITGTGCLTLFFAAPAFAFHAGGTGNCTGCHIMHASSDSSGSTTNAKLLKGSDDSSTCLNCHLGSSSAASSQGYFIASPDGSYTNSGGDFYWVKVSYTYPDSGGGTSTSTADSHGHNIVAADYGFTADTVNSIAPGGTYPAADLGCTSCHDPHGTVNGGTANGTPPISGSGSYGMPAPTDGTILGNYRLLGDKGYTPPGSNAPFDSGAPVARADGVSGRTVDYGSGMSAWCVNCHAASDTLGSSMHPAGKDIKFGQYLNNYNSYLATGNLTGTPATSYDALVPFERGTTDSTTLWNGANGPINGTAGPDGNSNVMCLTCHRAHASAFSYDTRWDTSANFLSQSGPLLAGVTFSDGTSAAGKAIYYKDGATIDIAAAYGQYQRSLCNKCHIQD